MKAPNHHLSPPPSYRPKNGHLLLALAIVFPLLLLTGVGNLVALVVVIGWGQLTAHGMTGLLLSLMVLLAGCPIAVAMHELGHTAAAVSFRWPVHAFRVGPMVLEKVGGRWRFHWHWRANWLTGIAVVNPTHPSRGQMAAFVLAGPVVSLLGGGLMTLALIESLPGWMRCISVTVAAWSWLLATSSSFPFRHRGQDTDGRVLLHLWLNPGWVWSPNASVTRQQAGLPTQS